MISGKKERNAPTYDAHAEHQHGFGLAHLNHAFNFTSAFFPPDIMMAIKHSLLVSGPIKGIQYVITSIDSSVL